MKHELLITLDRDRAVPLNRQIYEQIRTAIHSGALSGGDPLPPTRMLAKQLSLSRSVVLQAYELLQAEGYLEMRKGAGTFVTGLQSEHGSSGDDPVMEMTVQEDPQVHLKNELDLSLLIPDPIMDHAGPGAVFCDFRHGVPAWDAFPMDSWQKALMNACRSATPQTLGYGPAEGSFSLRQEIARLLRSTRSIPVTAEQIVITAGATQALDILARLCLSKGDGVIMEDPTHHTIREIFRFSGAEIIPVTVDEEGITVEDFDKRVLQAAETGQGKVPKLIYVTPSHQFPLGATMSLSRRIQLLRWAKSHDALIIEDDYDSEYRYDGPKLSALAGLDSGSRVAYIGSFSKILFPALRIGYIILPPSMIPGFLAVKWLADRMSPALDQEALAEFLKSGQYARHVARMNKLYAGRRSCLLHSLKKEFGPRVCTFGEEAGLHVLVELDSPANENDIAAAALRYGVRIYPASSYFVGSKPQKPVFLLGYSNLTESQLESGVQAIRRAEADAKTMGLH
ncbi:MocR-like pyridoxine biosynthesis transcription factor PdxR [Paenibacillus sp. FSL L8-0463]|uniref:MocR-like pyridoxine biosynthesis transcription factor PdxR n=1 Tax=Paenibacillus sp. FSL L8-0463 TaxID=2954687 RepID=UPI0031194909